MSTRLQLMLQKKIYISFNVLILYKFLYLYKFIFNKVVRNVLKIFYYYQELALSKLIALILMN